MSDTDLEAAISTVRGFSRFYTRRMGVLQDRLLGAPLSLAEARVIYELAQTEATTAGWLAPELGLDGGYLSRILRDLHERGLIDRRRSETDGRQTLLSLTTAGRAAFAEVDALSQEAVGAMLANLPPGERHRLVVSLAAARTILGDRGREPAVPYILRSPQVGDLGWVVHRQAFLYAKEYGFDADFEALVAEIVAAFIRNFDARRERCWIAERDGGVVGSVFLVRESDTVGKLRLLYVEPDARGLGIGRRLVQECIRHARQCGYRRLTLWTNDVLGAARRIYQREGFRLAVEEQHHSFGQDLIGQNWNLDL